MLSSDTLQTTRSPNDSILKTTTWGRRLALLMKMRLPGFKTTISINFVFILIGIALFSFGETVLIGLGGALVPSLWKTQQRPKAVQVQFNAA